MAKQPKKSVWTEPKKSVWRELWRESRKRKRISKCGERVKEQKKNILLSIFHRIFHRRIKEESCWSNLPNELLGLMASRLFGLDYSSFHNVCRTWRSGGNPFPLQISPCQYHVPVAQIPWLVYFEEEAHVLNVSHPLCKSNLIEISGLSDSRICCSKDGWLLIWQFSRRVFFLNPFNRTRIELPDFPREKWDYPSCRDMDVLLPALSFSSPPVSLDCVVFGISSSCDHDEAVSICIISRGEASWTIHNRRDNNNAFTLSNVNPIYHNGNFYCLGEGGDIGLLGIFDPHKDHWTIEYPTISFFVSIEDVSSFFVQCNGNLFLVFQGPMGKGVFVFVLDFDGMTWNLVQHLEDYMFFSSGQISLSAKTVPAFNEMGNKIYFPMFPLSCDGNSSGGDMSSCVFYSLSTEMYHSFGSSLSSRDISRMKILRNCAWVEPNFVIPSIKELIWAI
ncbi:hypothetical protein NE237_032845 [Protea cynaroides]|uniref:KIB1-4 beta-propeller domain-containing protein n=1 Tax=Protea cynaroides TaxID=273540 RepID=A0A9Q0L3S5_9MAGN|nr:hypothetical protein NE237_032845 [Protea cynaroides]